MSSIFTTYKKAKEEFREKSKSLDGISTTLPAQFWRDKILEQRKDLESHLTQTVERVLEVNKKEVLEILVDEINTAHLSDFGKTSRLTSAYNRIAELFDNTLSLIKEEGDSK